MLTIKNVVDILILFFKKNEIKKQIKRGASMAVDYLRVKAERIARGYTQDYMAKQLGWSDRARYAKRENGFVSFDADELAKVAEVLGISKDDIGIFFTYNVR
ncbi:Transcriptional regulator, Cro family [Streptococcus phage 10750.2]|nr:Transcriptional regulator, Cro family [Streptococcus pyogenes MGAS10270]ABF37787.1 Transcriptional regulator, Cro family [Streptococcus pyogenes MGAS10750]